MIIRNLKRPIPCPTQSSFKFRQTPISPAPLQAIRISRLARGATQKV